MQRLARGLVQQMLETEEIATWLWDLRTDQICLTPAKNQLRDSGDEFHITVKELIEAAHRDDRPRLRQWIEALRQGQAVADIRYRALHRNGQLRDFLASADVCTGHGELRQILGRLQDISTHAEMERAMLRRQAALLQLTRDVQSTTTSADEALHQIARSASKMIVVDRITIWLLRPEPDGRYHCISEYVAGHHRQSEEKPFRAEWLPTYFGALVRDRLIAAEHCALDPRVAELQQAYVEPRGVGAKLDVLVLHSGRPAGILCFESHSPSRRWELSEQQFAVSIADLLSTVLERTDRQAIEDKLAHNQALFDDLINNAPSAITIKDTAGRYLLANRAFARLTQQDAEQLLGKTDHELLPQPLATALSKHDRAIVESKRPLELVEQIPLAGGTRAFLSVKFPLFDPKGELYGAATISRDITDYEHTLRRLTESEARLRELAETPFDALLIHDRERILDANSNALKMYGYSHEELLRLRPADLTAPQDRGLSERMAREGGNTHYETYCLRADGSLFPVEVKARGANLNGVSVRVVAVRDLTEQRNNEQILRASEERYRAFIAASAEAIWRADIDPPMPISLSSDEQHDWLYRNARLAESNPAMLRMYGFTSQEEVHGQTLADLYDPPIYSPIALQFIHSGYSLADIEAPLRNRQGHCLWIQSSFLGVVEDDCLRRIWCLQRDFTERRQHISELEHQANHDSLTGLYNRKWLTAAVDARIAEQPGQPFALLFIDLDHFKEINDTLGHHVGDLLLAQVGPRLQAQLTEAALARLGGDEFAVLIPHFDNEQAVVDTTRALVGAIRQPFEVAGLRLQIGASVGIALFPQHGRDGSALMRCADIAMYMAKRDRLGWAVYQSELDEHSPRRLALMTDLGTAMHENQLFLVFQPKVALADGILTGFEALLRWQHPIHGHIPPAQFIPLAEMSEIIHPLTTWVMERALQQLHSWRQRGLATSIAINVSPRNLLDDELPDRLQQLLQRYPVPPQALQMEITESALITDPERALTILHRMHALGVSLAIDDFGTGYSSLAYLKQLPLDTLKIDMSFIRQMLDSHADATIVRTIVGLAHNLDLRVVAEGVENALTLDALQEMGCDEAQGYHIARPLPVEQASRYIAIGEPLLL